MGTGFSIDTPLKVAKYGISSVISLVDDVLIEQMRKFHSQRLGLQYVEITKSDKDRRANRITAYLNLMCDLVRDQVTELQASPFEPGSEITRYFELLPDSPLKNSYSRMLVATDSAEKAELQNELRSQAVPGSIDVNIMTKLDCDLYYRGNKQSMESADAMAALRGYAKSTLSSSIVFSAGLNRRLFNYLAKFDDFSPDDDGLLRKKIVLKVSDFRSARVQGKYFARRGLWVSEYRIESGLNCGGHAFPSDGLLMGPILREFQNNREELLRDLHKAYSKALATAGHTPPEKPHEVHITVQGGIGTAEENRFLMDQYNVDSTGWGTPFLLVPEVTNVDDVHLKKLSAASNSDVYLSDSSPLGIPFWNLRGSASEEARRQRLESGRPGSSCPKGYGAFDSEFTDVPICRGSRAYQKRKLKQLSEDDSPSPLLAAKKKRVEAKACICHDLAGGVTLKHGIDAKAHPAVCCGPNIVNFSKIASLEEMVGHIYGRLSLPMNPDRPHMFIGELILYVEFLRRGLEEVSEGLLDRTAERYQTFKSNMITGIEYYRDLAEQFGIEQKDRFLAELNTLAEEIESILPSSSTTVSLNSIT